MKTGINPVTLPGFSYKDKKHIRNVSAGRIWMKQAASTLMAGAHRHGKDYGPEIVEKTMTFVIWEGADAISYLSWMICDEDKFIPKYKELRLGYPVNINGRVSKSDSCKVTISMEDEEDYIVIEISSNKVYVPKDKFYFGLECLFPNGELGDNPLPESEILKNAASFEE